MAKYDAERELLDDSQIITSRISDTCRFVAFGLLAACYTIRSADNAFAKGIREGDVMNVVWAIGIAAALALVADYLQYFFAHISNKAAQRSKKQEYDHEACSARAREFFFISKQVLTFAGAVALIVLVATA
jgi:hypothetical protein